MKPFNSRLLEIALEHNLPTLKLENSITVHFVQNRTNIKKDDKYITIFYDKKSDKTFIIHPNSQGYQSQIEIVDDLEVLNTLIKEYITWKD